MLIRVVPKVFYARVAVGVDLLVACLGFREAYRDDALVVVERDGVKVMLVEDATFAAKDRPELSIESDAIEALHDEVVARRPDVLHPNLAVVTSRAWGAREFAVLDETGVCVVVRQW